MLLSNGSIVESVTSAPASLSDSTPWYGGRSEFLSGDGIQLAGMRATYAEIYKRQHWVGTVIRKLGMASARNPFEILQQVDEVQQARERGPLEQLLRRPNDDLDGLHLWLWTSSTYDIYGEAYWLKLRDLANTVRELYPIHPSNLVIRRGPDGGLEYLYGGYLPVPARDIVAFRNYNPDSLYRGLSNLESLRQTLFAEDSSRTATASWWRRGARPSVMLQHPKNLSKPAIERLRAQFDEMNAGAANMGRALVLEEAMQATVVQLSAEEMQYIESRKLNREEVCSSYDVPPPVVHILDRATFSNITEQLRSMYRDTMAPRFELFEAVVDHQLIPDFYEEDGSTFSRFNMDEVLRGDFEQRATSVTTLIQNGVFKPSEGRPLFGLPPAGPEADVLYGNAALVPLGSNPRSAAPVATDGTLLPQPLEPASRAISPQLTLRDLMGRLARTKGVKDTRAKLVDEYRKGLEAFFGEQRTAVLAAATEKAAGLLKPEDWDEQLATLLGTLGSGASQAVGSKVAQKLGAKYDPADLEDWLKASATESAANINRTTAKQLDDAINAMDDEDEETVSDVAGRVFDVNVAQRAAAAAVTAVAVVAGVATLTAGRQAGGRSKTWVVTASNPRSSHAALNGETVGLDEPFSNGMNAPGDPSGGADEVAGCTCELEINLED